MPNRSSKKRSETPSPKPTVDQAIETAATEQPKAVEKNPAAVALGRLGGLKGGKARAAKLTKEQRSEIAKKAAAARWSSKAN